MSTDLLAVRMVARKPTLGKQSNLRNPVSNNIEGQASTNEAQNSAAYKHIKDSGQNVNCHDVMILDREEQWHKRGIKEAIWERIEQPTLNKGDYA